MPVPWLSEFPCGVGLEGSEFTVWNIQLFGNSKLFSQGAAAGGLAIGVVSSAGTGVSLACREKKKKEWEEKYGYRPTNKQLKKKQPQENHFDDCGSGIEPLLKRTNSTLSDAENMVAWLDEGPIAMQNHAIYQQAYFDSVMELGFFFGSTVDEQDEYFKAGPPGAVTVPVNWT